MTEFSHMGSSVAALAANRTGAKLGRSEVLPFGGVMARKYSEAASKKVEKAMHERKRGTLKSGSSGRKVTSRKQAIAIGLSEARRAGKKVPSRRAASKRGST
jgi:hypothetical protein